MRPSTIQKFLSLVLIDMDIFVLVLGAANSGLPMRSPSKHRTSTETNRRLAKGDLGTDSVL